MTNKRLAYTRPDGGVSVVVPDPHYIAEFASEAEAIAAILAKDVPADASDVVEITTADLPGNRLFRDDWRMAGGRPRVDMTLARETHMNRIREMRDQKLAELDTEWQKALEENDAAKRRNIEAEKQRLRDLPQTFDLAGAETPEALVDLWPENLPLHVRYSENQG